MANLPLINVGTVANDHTGDPDRVAFQKTNSAIALANATDTTLAAYIASGGGGGPPVNTLPVASLPLTGAELVELQQLGVNVQSTVNSLNPAAFIVRWIDFGTYVGWDPTGVTNQSVILQQAVNDAIAAKLQLRIPVGLYLLNNPVDLAPSLFAGLDMVGISSPAGWVAGLGFSLTNHGPWVVFKANFTDRPAFYFTGARWIHLANFTVMGLNNVSQFQAPNDVLINYNPGLTCRNTQWSPYCGIAIDAFNIPVPADGGYPGMSASYNLHAGTGSSGMVFENISVVGFVVGWGVGLSGNQAGGTDTITWINCRSTICDTAVAVGQGQSKDCNWFFGGVGSCRTAFDGATYGSKQGYPVVVNGVNFGYFYRLFNYSSQFGPLFIQNCYAESVRSLGNFGTGGSTTRGHMSLANMQWSVETSNSGPPPPLQLETFGACSVRDMNFSVSSGSTPAWNFGNDLNAPITLDTCTFSTSATAGVPPLVGMSSTGPVVKLVNCLASGTAPYQPISDESTADVSAFTVNNRFVGPQRSAFYANGTNAVYYTSSTVLGFIGVAATATAQSTTAITFTASLANGAVSGNITPAWPNSTGWRYVTFSNGNVKAALFVSGQVGVTWGADALTSSATTAATVANVNLTFTATDSTLVQVGDIYLWKMLAQGGSGTQRIVPGYQVTSVVGSTVTCVPLFDALQYDTVANNFGGTTMNVCQIPWAPSGAALTATSATSTTLTGVSPITILKNGDWVSGTSFIAANSRVVSGGGTATVVLNKATTGNGATTLYFGRFSAPTLVATW